MDKDTSVSFIPKKSLAKQAGRRKRPRSLWLFLSSLIFFLTVASYGGLYFYNVTLEEVLTEKNDKLESIKKELDPTNVIESAMALQTKIDTARRLLDDHISLLPLFDFLERNTLKSVKFDSFSFSRKEATDAPASGAVNSAPDELEITISMKGRAVSYASLAFQSDVFAEAKRYIKSFSISNLKPDASGDIVFDFNAVLNPSFLLYANTLDRASIPVDAMESEEDTEDLSEGTAEEGGGEEVLGEVSDEVGINP
ncbi:MAG: hypothetical protein BMS9Abin13_363 [Patescibacteria group bacterium]|nr:MAG: hypothetical protein BMS9Abin13_363 [Patescibacteria group bacterium]